MSLEVETGTGSANAESYASVSLADTYLARRGYTLWATLSETEREQALRRATTFMGRYAWKGQRQSELQALDWPRTGVTANRFMVSAASVPQPVMHACIELAFRAASGELAPDQTQAVLSKAVGPIAVTYQAGSSTTRRFPGLDALIGAYVLGNPGGTLSVQRA